MLSLSLSPKLMMMLIECLNWLLWMFWGFSIWIILFFSVFSFISLKKNFFYQWMSFEFFVLIIWTALINYVLNKIHFIFVSIKYLIFDKFGFAILFFFFCTHQTHVVVQLKMKCNFANNKYTLLESYIKHKHTHTHLTFVRFFCWRFLFSVVVVVVVVVEILSTKIVLSFECPFISIVDEFLLFSWNKDFPISRPP